jgi:Fic family protein
MWIITAFLRRLFAFFTAEYYFCSMTAQNKYTIYNWQRPDWPNFSWDADALLAPLAEVSGLHGRLSGQMSMLGFNDKSETGLNALADELVNSSAIEGVALDVNSVRSSIARKLGMTYDGTFVEDHYVEGLVEVMLDAITGNNIPLDSERLFSWHHALFPMGRSGMYKITVGTWRVGDEPMQVVSGAFGHERVHYVAPPSDQVPMEMERFIKWCNECQQSPIVKAAIAHLWFVTIHPFDDGNGRICRTLTDMFLSQLNVGEMRYYSMSAEINHRKKAYYDILESTQRGSMDVTEWMLWFVDCLKSAILHTLESVQHTLAKAAFWDKNSELAINERQRKIINRLWDGFNGKLTTSKYAKICSCSQDTALRDINDLISKSILRDSGENGRNKNYLLNGDF